MKKSFSEKDFFCWLESCCSEGKKQETVEIKTLVSDLVPKDEFIPDSMSSFARNFKRITDCIVALITMVVFLPLALCCYIAIKLEDGGPVYLQTRTYWLLWSPVQYLQIPIYAHGCRKSWSTAKSFRRR